MNANWGKLTEAEEEMVAISDGLPGQIRSVS